MPPDRGCFTHHSLALIMSGIFFLFVSLPARLIQDFVVYLIFISFITKEIK